MGPEAAPLRVVRHGLLGGALGLFACLASAATLHLERTPFQVLRVEREAAGLVKLCDADCGFIQGRYDPARPDLLPDDYMRANLVLGLGHGRRLPKRVLLVGMGTGAMARYLLPRLPDARFDLVEVDAAVPPLARRFFGLPVDARLKVHVADGRRFIEGVRSRYDLIFQDASFGAEPPAHLSTVEYVGELARHLGPDGVVVANLAAPALNPRLNAMVSTYRAVFAQVSVFPTESPANVALVAYAGATPLARADLEARLQALRAGRVIDYAIDPATLSPYPWRWPAAAVLRDLPPRQRSRR